MNDAKLLPCPFCGGSAKYKNDSDLFGSRIECRKCGALSEQALTREEAASHWNRRAPSAPDTTGNFHPTVRMPVALLPETARLVRDFASALAEKLHSAQVKYGFDKAEWRRNDWQETCREKLMEHIQKGDPRDVAAYCAFMWYHGWSTAGAPSTPAQPDRQALFDAGAKLDKAIQVLDSVTQEAVMYINADSLAALQQVGHGSVYATVNCEEGNDVPLYASAPPPAPQLDEDKEREAFEVWADSLVYQRPKDGGYGDSLVQISWEAWLARARYNGGK